MRGTLSNSPEASPFLDGDFFKRRGITLLLAQASAPSFLLQLLLNILCEAFGNLPHKPVHQHNVAGHELYIRCFAVFDSFEIHGNFHIGAIWSFSQDIHSGLGDS